MFSKGKQGVMVAADPLGALPNYMCLPLLPSSPRRMEYVGFSAGSPEELLSTLDVPENPLGSFEKIPDVQAVSQVS